MACTKTYKILKQNYSVTYDFLHISLLRANME